MQFGELNGRPIVCEGSTGVKTTTFIMPFQKKTRTNVRKAQTKTFFNSFWRSLENEKSYERSTGVRI